MNNRQCCFDSVKSPLIMDVGRIFNIYIFFKRFELTSPRTREKPGRSTRPIRSRPETFSSKSFKEVRQHLLPPFLDMSLTCVNKVTSK